MALFPTVGRKQPLIRFSWWCVALLLSLGVIIHLIPFYFMITSSLKTGTETLANPPTIWPQHVTFAAWMLVLNIASGAGTLMPEPFYLYLWNSLYMTVLTILISLPITSMAAYANSKLQRGPAARWTFVYLISMLMVPQVTTLIPSVFLTLHFPFAFPRLPTFDSGDPYPSLQIWDTPLAVIIPSLFNGFNFLIFKGFFDSIPTSVIQAARVDGGSEFNIFRRIVVPMSVPVFAAAAWLQFSSLWDGNFNFLWSSLVLRSPDKLPTSVAIYTLINTFTQQGTTSTTLAESQKTLLEQGLTWNGLMVLGLLQTIPIFVMFLVCRNYLLSGIRIRGLK
ncbi:carbohydrate ABC transporter permease [Tengunoibacter tsumagoiensis]|uniref:ABC transporter permease n=1 Tax=Tengunoibacter tsumagoiensis TaxID=2014871 RepID=A0A402A109_9CHLR|nr:carbohydrate ABC transporter permease [Tengunoibacter tsumagoiensis]GCE12765.1 ABC transporter permease [Tengunoibacter tsumagoiensis]